MNAAPAITGALRVGTDLVHVPDVAASIDRFGARYLHRVYTDAELDTCRSGAGGWSPERLAARFAAKEAVLKVLRPADGVSVRDIEVGADSRVDHGILVEKSNSWFNFGSNQPPRVVIGPRAVVQGTLVFEREVELYVSDTARIGEVKGATPIKFSGENP